jgi:hypothetical protein
MAGRLTNDGSAAVAIKRLRQLLNTYNILLDFRVQML